MYRAGRVWTEDIRILSSDTSVIRAVGCFSGCDYGPRPSYSPAPVQRYSRLRPPCKTLPRASISACFASQHGLQQPPEPPNCTGPKHHRRLVVFHPHWPIARAIKSVTLCHSPFFARRSLLPHLAFNCPIWQVSAPLSTLWLAPPLFVLFLFSFPNPSSSPSPLLFSRSSPTFCLFQLCFCRPPPSSRLFSSLLSSYSRPPGAVC